MYKNYANKLGRPKRRTIKIWLIMRLTIVILIATFIQVSAASFAQRITLSEKNTPLENVFEKISIQSGFDFIAESALLKKAKNVTINVKNIGLKQLLEQLFENQSLTFDIKGKIVIISQKEPPRTDEVILRLDIKGKVVDEKGLPIPGATIKVKGANMVTSTDGNGLFVLKNVTEGSVLEVSSVGYKLKEVKAARELGNIMLEVAVGELNEVQVVVAVGYGTQKKTEITGSVSTMSAKDLSVVPVSNVATLLAGKLPGLVAVQRSGEPGKDAPDLSIRGFGKALVVVDGIPGRDFTSLDPTEIENITILKDAAAAAVYGVSGGNGVVLVTTKKGTSSKPVFTYSMDYGVQTVTKYPDFVNSEQYAILKNEASINSGGGLVYSAEEVEKFRNGTDPNYPNFDYYDYFVRDYTPQVNQKITVRGGSEKINYFFLLGGIQQASMWEGGNQDYSKYNFRSNVTAKINDDLDVSVDFSANTKNRKDLTQNSYLMASWLQYSWPIFGPKTPDGKIASTNYGLTAYLDPELSGYIKGKQDAFQGSLSLNYKLPFVPGLSAKITAAQDMFFENSKNWLKKYDTYAWNPVTQTSVVNGSRGTNELTAFSNKWQSSHIQASLNYARTFADKHNLKALLLYEESEYKADSIRASRINYVVPIDQIFAGPDQGKNNGGGASDDGRQSLVGRLNYNYAGKYLLEYSFRYDGSPRFPADTRWGYFSGLSAGWRISEEKFIKENFETIDNLKLRFSWGKLGNDNTGKFQYLTGFKYPAQNYILGGNVVSNGMIDTGTPNPFITWEKSETYNLGLDVSLWKGLFGFEADIFHRKRNGILATRALQLPSTFGSILPSENLNSDVVNGFEVVLHHDNQIGEVRYNISTNFSYTRPRWEHVEQREFTSTYDQWRNSLNSRNINVYKGLKAIGQFQSEADIKSSPIQDLKANSTLRPGDIKYDDYNGDGIIDDGDTQVLGRGRTPEINYGLSVNLSWKKFGLAMNWQGAANFNVMEESFLISPFFNGMNSYAYFMDRWHREDPADPNSSWIPGRYPSTMNAGAPNNNKPSSFWFHNASYLRLKSLSISYSIQNSLLKKIGLEDLTIALSGQNLLTITGLDYIDPEAPSGRLSYYPQQKTYNIGINATF